MSETNFKSLLSTSASEVEAPKPIPAGSYRAIILDHEFGTTRRKETPYVRFGLRPTEPLDDVEEEEFEEYGGMEKLGGASLRADYYITPNALFMLRKFLEEACKLDLGDRGFDELIPETTNVEVIVSVTHSTSDNGEQVYTNVSQITATED